LSSERSATKRFSRACSCSRPFSRLACSTRKPPYSFFHRSYVCSVMPSFRQASAIPIPLPASLSTVRRWQMLSSAVYRVRAMPPPFVGWNPHSRPDLVYRGQGTSSAVSPGACLRYHQHQPCLTNS
jgi:hypothetical protein